MCRNIVDKDKCKLKMADQFGRRNPNIAVEINERFKELAESRTTKEESPLGVGCGGPHCCYITGKFATQTECPYYQI